MDFSLTELTRAEEQVMLVLWQRGPSFVKEVRAALPAAPPLAYTTVSTLIRLLEQKGFVQHEAFGRTHRYAPLVAQDVYRAYLLRKLVGSYFEGSFGGLLNFHVRTAGLDAAQLGQLVGQAYQQLAPAAAAGPEK
ncbi:MAG TPA: BlaI/MecI/CopY family transcriptional regulator [Hymenobacter sp.]|uniref:BlaI/MecI/CopY family transcriptional regulator n=1 Tax=Hymenobacter sp. TaxID=1898978 RepID=UPI002D7E893D|nr:BlaI/MecI/CopY family transcriptional regulator [Hymenobacter sp.]HET9504496.1 BlaI/MecI/CopY family transcriptional regulator [Hymenobacter sp.]